MNDEPEKVTRSALITIDGRDFAVISHALSLLRNPEGDAVLEKFQKQVVRQIPDAIRNGGF